jgi:hypothetical protein
MIAVVLIRWRTSVANAIRSRNRCGAMPVSLAAGRICRNSPSQSFLMATALPIQSTASIGLPKVPER